MNNAAVDVKDYLNTQLSANVTLSSIPIYVSQEPANIDNVITIYNYNGLDESCLDNSFAENAQIQLRIKNNNYEDGRDAHEIIRVILQGAKFYSTEVSSIYNIVYRSGTCIDLKRDESNRSISVQNYGVLRSET